MPKFTLRRCVLAILRPLFRILFPCCVKGLENLPKASADNPIIVCCNHISIVDPVFLLCLQSQHIYFMAKAELFKNRFTSWFLGDVMGAFPVNRGKGDMTAVNHAFDLVNSGNILGIFPQGTCRRTRELGLPKSGAALIAARTGATVVPAALVTKDFHVRAFKRTTLLIGKPLTSADLQLHNDEHPKLRFASRTIMEQIDLLIATECGERKEETNAGAIG